MRKPEDADPATPPQPASDSNPPTTGGRRRVFDDSAESPWGNQPPPRPVSEILRKPNVQQAQPTEPPHERPPKTRGSEGRSAPERRPAPSRRMTPPPSARPDATATPVPKAPDPIRARILAERHERSEEERIVREAQELLDAEEAKTKKRRLPDLDVWVAGEKDKKDKKSSTKPKPLLSRRKKKKKKAAGASSDGTSKIEMPSTGLMVGGALALALALWLGMGGDGVENTAPNWIEGIQGEVCALDPGRSCAQINMVARAAANGQCGTVKATGDFLADSLEREFGDGGATTAASVRTALTAHCK